MKTALLHVSRTCVAVVLLALSLTAAAVPSGKPEDVGLSGACSASTSSCSATSSRDRSRVVTMVSRNSGISQRLRGPGFGLTIQEPVAVTGRDFANAVMQAIVE